MAVQEIKIGIMENLPIIQQKLLEYGVAVKFRFIELLFAPLKNTEMLWLLVPIIINMLVLEFYFSRYKEEELGWNTAFGNSLVLIFVAVMLAKYLYTNELLGDSFKLAVVSGVLIIGFILTTIDFFHLVPRHIAFGISSKLPINFLSYAAIILVYTDRVALPLDYITGSAFFIMLVLIFIFVGLLHVLIPPALSPPEPSTEAPEI